MKYAARNSLVLPADGIEFFIDPIDQIWVYAVNADAIIEFGNAQRALGDSITVPAGEDRAIDSMSQTGISFVRIRSASTASPSTVSCIVFGKG